MKLIFLDFDGVILNARSFHVCSGREAIADPICIAALNRITGTTGAEIVVSSSWRLGTPLIELRRLLKEWGAQADVIGRTPFTEYSRTRGSEIAEWMRDCPRDVEAFVILDDDDDMGHLKDRLVLTDFNEGLTDSHADQAIQMLLRSAPPRSKEE